MVSRVHDSIEGVDFAKCIRPFFCNLQIMVFGEITTRSPLDYQKIIRDTVKQIGYDHSDKGFDYKSEPDRFVLCC